MATAALATIVDELTSTVDYLRITVGGSDEGWLPCEQLVSDVGHLAAVVAGTNQARGTDRDDVATLSVTVLTRTGSHWRLRSLSDA